jgi:hypothetical protein
MKRRLRLWMGWQCQRVAWWLQNPHDRWVIDWNEPDRKSTGDRSQVISGPYSAARAFARERNGRIVGHSASTIHD